MLRYLELLRCDAVRAYRSAEDLYCGERCKMCAFKVVDMLLVRFRFGGSPSCSTWIMKRCCTRSPGRLFFSMWRSDSMVTWRMHSWLSSRGSFRISRCTVFAASHCSLWCCPVVEHLCCEAYKIAHPCCRLWLRAFIYGTVCVCGFPGDLRFICERVPYADLLASVFHLFR